MKYAQICPSCNNAFVSKRYPNGYCQRCYNYFRTGGSVYPIPAKGIIAKDEQGKIICHVCGKSFKVVGDHVRLAHNMTIKEYKEEFGICNNTHLTESDYHNKMKNYALHYDMDKQLIATGVNTRISPTRKLRLGKTDREQSLIAKRNRKK